MMNWLMKLAVSLFQRGQGARTYLAGAALAGLGVLLLATGGDSTFALFLLAQGGGLAALRSAMGRIQSFLTTLQKRLDALGQTLD